MTRRRHSPAWPAAASRCRVEGFSLVELVVVMVLMAILTALVLPQMRGTLEDERLRRTSRSLLDALHLAYSQSVTLRQPHRLQVDPGSGRYQVERRRSGEESGPAFLPLTGLPGCQGTLDRRIQCRVQAATGLDVLDLDRNTPVAWPEPEDSTANVITFFADGTADAREIVLRDRDGFGQVLRVHPVTARIQVIALDRAGRPHP